MLYGYHSQLLMSHTLTTLTQTCCLHWGAVCIHFYAETKRTRSCGQQRFLHRINNAITFRQAIIMCNNKKRCSQSAVLLSLSCACTNPVLASVSRELMHSLLFSHIVVKWMMTLIAYTVFVVMLYKL